MSDVVEFDPIFEQAVAEFLFNNSKFRRRRFQEGEVVKEIFEYYFRHGRDCNESAIEGILNMFNGMLEKNKRTFG